MDMFQQRRATLAKQLPPNAIAVVPAAHEVLRNGDAHYAFRQDSDFYYLTGFNEPDALLLIRANGESILFTRPRHLKEEQWTGKRLGPDDALTTLGLYAAYSLQEVDARLPELLANQQAIYYALGQHPTWQRPLFSAWQKVQAQSRQGTTAPSAFCDLAPILGELRLKKDPHELQAMREAARISIAGHRGAMCARRTAQYEYQLEAAFRFATMQAGCRQVAYEPIVASGANACVLHYTANDQLLAPQDLVLIDAGAEYQGYAADITRVFPLQGVFTAEQRQIYQLVYAAQQAAIAEIRPGMRWDTMQNVVVRCLTEGLVELGLLKGLVDDLIAEKAYAPFYMHQSGHWLGLDVHDRGAYKIQQQWRPLEANMVLTVEPGLYITPGTPHVDPRWWGIGVRIEDDIAVTANGYENLTADLPSEWTDIEVFLRE